MAYTDSVRQVRRACQQMREQAAQDLPNTARSHGQVKAAFARISAPNALCVLKQWKLRIHCFYSSSSEN